MHTLDTFSWNYFVQGIYYDPDYKVFNGFPDKSRHLRILEAYFKNTAAKKNISGTISTNMTWRGIGGKVDEIFIKDYGLLTRASVQFYGNDNVCLFKYFVRSNDARRSRQPLGNITDITDQKGDLAPSKKPDTVSADTFREKYPRTLPLKVSADTVSRIGK